MKLLVSVWTTRFIGTPSHLDQLLDFLEEFEGGRFCPERWNFYEPLRHRYSREGRAPIIKEWTEVKPPGSGSCVHMLLMKRLGGKMDLMARCRRTWGPGRMLNSVYLTMTCEPPEQARIGEAALRRLVEITGACLGCVEPSNQALRRDAPGTPVDRVSQADWLMYWGEPYLELIGRERLLGAPWAKAEESPGGVFTWVTQSPADPALTETVETQKRIEAAIGSDLFPEDRPEPEEPIGAATHREMMRKQPRERKCRTPRFDFSELVVRKPRMLPGKGAKHPRR